jgi:hypothetical protein
VNINIRAGDVPVLIRKTAEEIAGCFYEMTRTERFRTQAGTQRQFIKRHWKDHLGHALESLSGVLAMPGFPDEEKTKIYDAITEFHDRAKSGTPRNLSLRNWQ